MIGTPLPVKYVLYSHYSAFESDDFKDFNNGVDVDKLKGIFHLTQHFRGLKELLTTPGHEGLLVLFYAADSSLPEFLEGIADREKDSVLLEKSKSLKFVQAVAGYIRNYLAISKLEDRVRFLTPIDLRVILGRVNTIFAGQFKRFFIGPAKGIRYDTPKIVEAIIRLRLLGNGVPVLRLDHDVIFRGKNKDIGDLGLFKSVACSVRAYQLRLAQPTVSTFIFSASYNTRPLLHPTEGMDKFEAWSRAFATRIYPALLANPQEIHDIYKIPQKENQDTAWNTYVSTNLDEELARMFYGLKEDPNKLEVDGINGLASIGAHPVYAVISGALLCLSEGAILDLPPFSNLRNNVMWIDDHLKYSLHRAMNHFTSGDTLNLEPGLSDARMDDVSVTKGRPPVSNLPSYIFGVYLPTLLWGTIMDAWITKDSIMKCRFDLLNDSAKENWHKAKQEQHTSILSQAMVNALSIGIFTDDAEDALRDALEKLAIDRIESVRQLWSKLKKNDQNTFASYWAEGKVIEVFDEKCFADRKDRLWEGIAPNIAITEPIKALTDLSTIMNEKVHDLINDTINYVRWSLEWPRFVQIVRSIRQGDFITDLSWRP